jgi:ABC-type uncharacterized transport system fused permease/ATPase subunit
LEGIQGASIRDDIRLLQAQSFDLTANILLSIGDLRVKVGILAKLSKKVVRIELKDMPIGDAMALRIDQKSRP